MNQEIERLIKALGEHKVVLENNGKGAGNTLEKLRRERAKAARKYVQELVPDTNRQTIASIEAKLIGFHAPRVPAFIFFTKVDPDLNLHQLQTHVGVYLDSTEVKPSDWSRTIGAQDAGIVRVEESLQSIQKSIEDLEKEIAALEKLKLEDLSNADPKYQQRLDRALGARLANPHAAPRLPKRQGFAPRYPSSSDLHSDDGHNLLMTWLWYDLMFNTPSRQAAAEHVPSVNHGHHSHEQPAVPPSTTSDILQPPSVHYQEHVGHDHIEHHIAAGAQSYS